MTQFSDADMARLVRANGAPGNEAAPGAPTMACHRDQPGTAHPMRLCAGWLAVVGQYHLGIRIAQLDGQLPTNAHIAAPEWPPLHANLDSLLAARAAQLRSLAVCHSVPADGPHAAAAEPDSAPLTDEGHRG